MSDYLDQLERENRQEDWDSTVNALRKFFGKKSEASNEQPGHPFHGNQYTGGIAGLPEEVAHELFARHLDPATFHEHAKKFITILDQKHVTDPKWSANVEAVKNTMKDWPMIHTTKLEHVARIAQQGLTPAHTVGKGLEFDRQTGLDKVVYMRQGQAGGGGHGAVGVIVDPSKLDKNRFLVTKLGLMTLKQEDEPILHTPGDHRALLEEQLKPFQESTIDFGSMGDVQARLLVDGYMRDHPGEPVDPERVVQNDHGVMEVKYIGTVPPDAITAYFGGDYPLEDGKSASEHLRGLVPDDKIVVYHGEGLSELSKAYRHHYSQQRAQLVNSFPGHEGRPGQRGGSAPRDTQPDLSELRDAIARRNVEPDGRVWESGQIVDPTDELIARRKTELEASINKSKEKIAELKKAKASKPNASVAEVRDHLPVDASETTWGAAIGRYQSQLEDHEQYLADNLLANKVYNQNKIRRSGEVANEPEGHAFHGNQYTGGIGGRVDIMSPTTKAARAKASYKPQTKEKSAVAWWAEGNVVKAIDGTQLKNNDPADIIKGKNAIEVKSIFEAGNDKLTCRKDRKVKWGKSTGRKWHTVAVDIRGCKPVFHYAADGVNVDRVTIQGEPKWYYKEGVGSFRLGSMKPIQLEDLKRLIK